MLTTFQHLSPEQTTRLVELVKKIVKAVNPDKIICYGSRTNTIQDWSIFIEMDGLKETVRSTFDLLIITNDDEKRADHEIIQAIEQQAELLACAVTVIVQKLAVINELLGKGARFATAIYGKGILVYNGSGLPLASPSPEPDTSNLKSKIENNWTKCFSQAQRFFKTASFCFKNGWHEQVAFDLHQAVQHTCMALLRVFTGYRSTTHNLSRLLELIRNFTCDFLNVFPCITKEEADLFNLLNKAYSEARYNEQYAMPAEKSAVLMERVRKLMAIAEKLYEKKLHEPESQQPVSFPLTGRQ